jgi:hypothetical protein
MSDAEWELELEKRVEEEDKEFEGDISPLETRLRLLEQWQAAQEAVAAMRRWFVPILVTVAVTFLNIGISFATHKH